MSLRPRAAVTEYADVPPEVLAAVRPICMALPEAYEEEAWVGHAVADPEADLRPRADGGGPVATRPTRAPLARRGPPRSSRSGRPAPSWRCSDRPGTRTSTRGGAATSSAWSSNPTTDWDEVAELLTESYCVLAPKKLVALVDRPEG